MRHHNIILGGLALAGIAAASLTGAMASPVTIASPVVDAAAADGGMIVLAQAGPRFEQHDGFYWYNGHRGSHKPRPGWRQFRGWWFPPAAFVIAGGPAGPDMGPGPDRPAPRHALPPQHYRWCGNHYRSYRASDNTFQPYNGPRRQCRSPYWR